MSETVGDKKRDSESSQRGEETEMVNRVNFKENKSWELVMPDETSIHRIEVFVGERYLDYFYVPTEYVKYFVDRRKRK